MTILEFTKLFPGYIFHLYVSRILPDGSDEYDGDFSYHGLAENFESVMSGSIFDINLSESVVDTIKVIKHAKICCIYLEYTV